MLLWSVSPTLIVAFLKISVCMATGTSPGGGNPTMETVPPIRRSWPAVSIDSGRTDRVDDRVDALAAGEAP